MIKEEGRYGEYKSNHFKNKRQKMISRLSFAESREQDLIEARIISKIDPYNALQDCILESSPNPLAGWETTRVLRELSRVRFLVFALEVRCMPLQFIIRVSIEGEGGHSGPEFPGN